MPLNNITITARLAQFGELVLQILQKDDEWNGDTLEEIQSAAYQLELAATNKDGYFETTMTR